ncbi:transcriptional regulator [Rhizobium leguminosarum bv. viciae]|uniref:Transcriptional regulator n=1 Tax=Rhizobium leguminosarum bv. viciae TaxID=387 RepID=A0A8I2GXE8_RHILV|nr:transcriptional regulator [Rhizobium leguminosarum]MBY5420073.1 transcriptional regulator [Rhizobium leguminosarum]MBY5427988.1 transcriptional regulator [Rhizobium leguminosarum]MBY5793874.1 transcriptional regulator [Rhizobium leguminosarum]NKL85489.1 transcriptional regulator [Rhizobium leguminosarum bv. viciae]NKM48187.1 transcriptional regulator [Rhizobium leguminosarum bv. viciae]
MKKVQRSFAVEYKSGRRKLDTRSNSIWGNMDLKSVARDLEEEALPFLSGSSQSGKSNNEMSLPEPDQAEALLTPPLGASTTASDTQEMSMADETETATSANAPIVVETPIAPKKQRKPRAKKAAALESASADAMAEPAAGLAGVGRVKRRGRKAKVIEATASAKRTPVRRAPKAVQTAPAAPMTAIDEMADLLQLEEENQRLRKLLAEKLRAENADLRKRLKLD